MKNKITTFDLLVHLYESQLNEYDNRNFSVNKNFLDIQVELILDFYKKYAPNAHLTSNEDIIMYMASDSNIMDVYRKEFNDYTDEEVASWTKKDIPRLIDIIKSKVKFR